MTSPASSPIKITIEDHSTDGLRSGEGSVVERADGGLLLLYTDFTGGGADESRACIVRRVSSDKGNSWSEKKILFEPDENSLNFMSVSLLRLQDGRIACVFMDKKSKSRTSLMWSLSEDEGDSWTQPVPLTGDEGYFVANNDRLVQLSDGTLLVPYAEHVGLDSDDVTKGGFDPAWNATCGIFYSMDGGPNWKKSSQSITHTPDIFTPPAYFDEAGLDTVSQEILTRKLGFFQEPGIVELSNGKLLMVMRSAYGVYCCISDGVEQPWRDCRMLPGFHVCTSPQTIRKIPGTETLLMIYNDRGTVPWGTRNFHLRTPISLAASNDDGQSWRKLGSLTDESRNYCYFSLLFQADGIFITCYESAGNPDARRSLASLVSFFEPYGHVVMQGKRMD